MVINKEALYDLYPFARRSSPQLTSTLLLAKTQLVAYPRRPYRRDSLSREKLLGDVITSSVCGTAFMVVVCALRHGYVACCLMNEDDVLPRRCQRCDGHDKKNKAHCSDRSLVADGLQVRIPATVSSVPRGGASRSADLQTVLHAPFLL